ncbi:hypothetical protein HHI36_007433 [Cryptolaemus montrouzieri]|uniref:Uronyl 2-sulfotransferase n=1 Tax=Cryptolaemus montrouzieri TaxID=559131 RepID=A0ABD2MPI7_9CUCU
MNSIFEDAITFHLIENDSVQAKFYSTLNQTHELCKLFSSIINTKFNMNLYFKVKCILYYSCLLTIIVLIFFLNTSGELEEFESELLTLSEVSGLYTVPYINAVTKSMKDLGKMDEINKYVLLMNQVPNCGGEFLILLLQKLQGYNNFRHIRLKRGKQILSSYEQNEFISILNKKMRDEAVPLSFDRSFYFINFTSFDKQSPTYINIIRDPIEKLSSRSHFGKESSLLKCIQMRKKCNIGDDINDFNIPYFCGQDPICRTGNSEGALQMAKNNVEKFYPVVGILEELNKTLVNLENRIPYFFKGALEIYEKKLSVDLPKFQLHMDPIERNTLKSLLKTEYEFYEWVKARLIKQMEVMENYS